MHFKLYTYKYILTNNLLLIAICCYNIGMLRLRIKEVAEAKGIGQGKLARAADMAPNTLRDLYRDPYRAISVATLNKLAKALDVPVTELIEDVSEEFAKAEKEKISKAAEK
jgi:transcriptional regulator with XRE-family HTH domain